MSDRVVLAESKDCTQVAIHGTVHQSIGIGPEAIICKARTVSESNRKQITSILENRSKLSYSEAESINEEARKLHQRCQLRLQVEYPLKFEDGSQQRLRTPRDGDDRSRHGNGMGEINRDGRPWYGYDLDSFCPSSHSWDTATSLVGPWL